MLEELRSQASPQPPQPQGAVLLMRSQASPQPPQPQGAVLLMRSQASPQPPQPQVHSVPAEEVEQEPEPQRQPQMPQLTIIDDEDVANLDPHDLEYTGTISSALPSTKNIVAIFQEERDKLSDKFQVEVQRDSSCLHEQLSVVSLERKGALDERDALVSQLYKEIEETKRLEKESVQKLYTLPSTTKDISKTLSTLHAQGIAIQTQLTPLGVNIQTHLTPSGVTIQTQLTPSGVTIQTQLTPSGVTTQTHLTPSGVTIQTQLTPSGVTIQTQLTPSGVTIQTQLIPSGVTIQTQLTPSGVTIQTHLTSSGVTTQTHLTPSGVTIQTHLTSSQVALRFNKFNCRLKPYQLTCCAMVIRHSCCASQDWLFTGVGMVINKFNILHRAEFYL
ncbi:hypothetical protein EMCRGX_G007087 [Ephydatia muelleri]